MIDFGPKVSFFLEIGGGEAAPAAGRMAQRCGGVAEGQTKGRLCLPAGPNRPVSPAA
ncbi:hypothetical protein SGRA_1292 [Saprospira grandis str. Lewin]|uniref:Uncharacterized protein n=1 Tax=Saprospira grandis (strain Lewin) TaxID=984262 RepID=H6L5B3_SAPGL|nr:hypothetical protein SGRA_1292 [Saprospira grandis str. Lewin]